MHLMQSPPGPRTIIDGREVLYFAGTSYLGLHGHPRVMDAACAAMRAFGLGSGTSPAGFGHNPPAQELQETAARFFDQEAALHLTSGFIGPRVLLDVLRDRFDVLLVDEYAHYSVLDAAHTSGLPAHSFAHNDVDNLAQTLARVATDGRRPLVMADGVSPIRGAIAPVPAYLRLLERRPGAGLLLDDAHAVGVLGAHGRGTYEHFDVESARVNTLTRDGTALFCCGTLSKAIGGHGGIIAGTRALIDRLRQASPLCFAASQPAVPVVAAAAEALRLVMQSPQLLDDLRRNARRLRAGLRKLGVDAPDEPVPIAWLQLGDAQRMQRLQRELLRSGIAIAYMPRYPGVGPAGGLRIAVCATHTPTMIDHLLDHLQNKVSG